MREKLRAGGYLQHLGVIAKAAETAPVEKIPAMRLQADIYLRLLNKVLPDLKAIEHTGEVIRKTVSEKPMSESDFLRRHAETRVQ